MIETIADLIVFGAKEVDVNNLRSIPNSGGVYFLCNGLDIIYIGHSGGMRDRVRLHIQVYKVDRILFIRYNGRVRHAFEKLFIQIFKPMFNHQTPDLPDNIESLLSQAGGVKGNDFDFLDGYF